MNLDDYLEDLDEDFVDLDEDFADFAEDLKNVDEDLEDLDVDFKKKLLFKNFFLNLNFCWLLSGSWWRFKK